MASSVVYSCDNCGTQKRTANHWFLLVVEPRRMEIRPWSAVDSTPGARHVCGESCLSSEISSAIANGKAGAFGLRCVADQEPVEYRAPARMMRVPAGDDGGPPMAVAVEDDERDHYLAFDPFGTDREVGAR